MVGADSLRLQFLDETPQEIKRILKTSIRILLEKKKEECPIKEYTRGHYGRGVE